jgi:hypothetical protein
MLDTAARSLTTAAAPTTIPGAEPLGAPMPVPGQRSAARTSPTPPTAPDARHALDDDEGTPTFARHMVGFLLGLLLTPAGVALLGVGLGRLDAVAEHRATDVGMLDVGLLAGGVGLLVCVALLGAWTPAIPITGGLVWGVVAGAAAMVWPRITEDLLASTVDDALVPVDHLARTATGGDLAAVGALLIGAGTATAIARRRGRRRAERAAADARRDGRVTTTPAHSRA